MMNEQMKYDLRTLNRLENRFLTAYHKKEHEKACEFGNDYCTAVKQYYLHSTDKSKISEAVFQLACAYDEADNAKAAIKLYLEVVSEDTAQQNNKAGRIFADACNNLAVLYSESNQLDDAVFYFNKCYHTRTLLLPHGDKDLIDVCYNLALTYSRLANIQKGTESSAKSVQLEKHNTLCLANKFYAKALNMRTERDIFYADNMYNMGVTYIADSADEIGILYISKALDIYKNVTNDPEEYATALSFYCSLLHTLGYDIEAFEAYKDLLDCQNLYYATAYLPISNTLSCLSKCCVRLGDTASAIEYKKQAIAAILKGFINKPLMYTMSVAELGALYAEIEDYNQAEVQFKEALDVRTYLLGADDAVCISYVFALCNIYIKTKQHKKAEALLCHTLDILQPSETIYTELALTLVAICMDAEDGNGIRIAYELFNKAHPEKGFDEMLDMAEDMLHKLKSAKPTQSINNLFK
jgi:tetratricopeptide (TPR) repeat protein